MLILCLARVAVLGVAAITLASSTAVTAVLRASPEVVAQRRSSFAVVCACSVYFVISNLPPGRKKKKRSAHEGCLCGFGALAGPCAVWVCGRGASYLVFLHCNDSVDGYNTRGPVRSCIIVVCIHVEFMHCCIGQNGSFDAINSCVVHQSFKTAQTASSSQNPNLNNNNSNA